VRGWHAKYRARIQELEAHMDEANKRADAFARENENLRWKLVNCEEYASEGWGWLDDALAALGAETVFDIPKAKAK
jgi:hypothetical protein